MASAEEDKAPAQIELLIQSAHLAALGCSVWVKGAADEMRDAWQQYVAQCVLALENPPPLRAPAHLDREALLGGVDLAASLREGKKQWQVGLLEQAKNRVLILQMAERWDRGLATELALALDEQPGTTLLAFDESLPETQDGSNDTPLLKVLADRLPIQINLRAMSIHTLKGFEEICERLWCESKDQLSVARSAQLRGEGHATQKYWHLLAEAGLMLGVDSMRCLTNAVGVLKNNARLAGRLECNQEDFDCAVALSLLPRATQLPPPAEQPPQPTDEQATEQQSEPESTPDQVPPEPPLAEDSETSEKDDSNASEDTNESEDTNDDSPTQQQLQELAELILQAAAATLPNDLLAQLTNVTRIKKAQSGQSGSILKNAARGRKIGAVRKPPKAGSKPDLLSTLFASLPWQGLRKKPEDSQRIRILASDFRYAKREQSSESLLIFAVDASGSSAMNRLAESKGAIELLLAQSYSRRDQVAMISFRSNQATTMLEPTRSLTRAKRGLASLPGGGATPIAAGIEKSLQMALQARQNGQTPYIIMLSDGRANITRNGGPGRPQAHAEAIDAAKRLAAYGISALFIDTSPQVSHRSQTPAASVAREIAHSMAAVYMALPYADARQVAQRVAQAIN